MFYKYGYHSYLKLWEDNYGKQIGELRMNKLFDVNNRNHLQKLNKALSSDLNKVVSKLFSLLVIYDIFEYKKLKI